MNKFCFGLCAAWSYDDSLLSSPIICWNLWLATCRKRDSQPSLERLRKIDNLQLVSSFDISLTNSQQYQLSQTWCYIFDGKGRENGDAGKKMRKANERRLCACSWDGRHLNSGLLTGLNGNKGRDGKEYALFLIALVIFPFTWSEYVKVSSVCKRPDQTLGASRDQTF